jgi:uncharacterized membrane protein YphA (DoxX/SURF4 family)
MNAVRVSAFVSGVSFLVYGLLCFGSVSMANDFHRFGLDNLRIMTGVMELLGGAGLLIGLRWEPALWSSSASLALLMLIAFGIRMRMQDGVRVSVPSFSFMLLNIYILVKSPKVSPFAGRTGAPEKSGTVKIAKFGAKVAEEG